MKLFARLLLTIFSLGICRADMLDVEVLYRNILAQPGGAGIPDAGGVAKIVNGPTLRDASPESVKAVLPLAAKCLDSTIPAVRADGILLLGMIAIMRPADNATLLAPYFEKVASFLSDPDVGIKRSAIYILSAGFPTPSPVALRYLAAHLNDDQSSAEQFIMISRSLLMGSPSDSVVVHSVLAAMQRRPDHSVLAGSMIEALGQEKITTEEALQFIRTYGIDSDKDYMRLTAVEAIGKLPKIVRDGFGADMQRLLANPAESVEVRNRVEEVLTH